MGLGSGWGEGEEKRAAEDFGWSRSKVGSQMDSLYDYTPIQFCEFLLMLVDMCGYKMKMPT